MLRNCLPRRTARLYGKCNNPFGHGHNYELEVSVAGPVDPRTGRVVDPRALDRLVRAEVLDAFDHRNLNTECEAFRPWCPPRRTWPARSSGACSGMAGRISGRWPRLERICIAETPRNIFEVEADEIQ